MFEEKINNMNKILFCLALLSLFSCRNRNPNLSDKQLLALINDTTQRVVFDADDASSAGVKFTEIRSVDPANPPVLLNIANRNLNIKKFNLSDYYTKVRYVKLKHPKLTKESNFLLDVRRSNVSLMDEKVWRRRDFIMGRSVFKFTDDYIIAGDACFGLHCYDKEGKFLYTIESNDFPKTYDATQSSITFAAPDVKGFYGRITTNGNNCLYCVMEDNKSMLCLYDLNQKKRIMTKPFEGRAFFWIMNHS